MNNIIPSLLFLLISASLTFVSVKCLIPYLRGRAKQPIYEGGPSWHMSKSGTPTMGGIGFLIGILISLLLAACFFIFIREDLGAGIGIIISLLFALGNSVIGIVDDLTKLKRKQNAGLTPVEKLLLQFLLAILFLMAREHFFEDSHAISFIFGQIDLGIFYYPLAIILLLGIVNCANLTDGIDGLASSTGLMIGAVYAIIGILSAGSEVSAASFALIGGMLGFLFYNKHPAKIFMGDTGSLFIGAMAVAIAFCTDNPFAIILIGGVYVIEGLSVILQVISYKLTKKRIFKMAPLHHHLEKCGLGEKDICFIAVVTTLAMSGFSFLFFGDLI